jgi:hypothetical protein
MSINLMIRTEFKPKYAILDASDRPLTISETGKGSKGFI